MQIDNDGVEKIHLAVVAVVSGGSTSRCARGSTAIRHRRWWCWIFYIDPRRVSKWSLQVIPLKIIGLNSCIVFTIKTTNYAQTEHIHCTVHNRHVVFTQVRQPVVNPTNIFSVLPSELPEDKRERSTFSEFALLQGKLSAENHNATKHDLINAYRRSG